MDVEQVYREAVARVQARRQPVEYDDVRLAWGETKVQKKLPEFKAPGTAAEFFDDRIARTRPGIGKDWVPLLYEIARADGAPAAVAVVVAAQKLKVWHQWPLYRALKDWGGAVTTATPLAAAGVLQAVAAEWGRRKLVSDEPTDEWIAA